MSARPPIVWLEEFPSSFRVPHEIVRMVEAGIFEDTSSRLEGCPTFTARLKDRNWVRLWVEYPRVQHAGAQRRREWPDRFTVTVHPDPTEPFGLKIVGTEDVGLALWTVIQVTRATQPAWRFKVVNPA